MYELTKTAEPLTETKRITQRVLWEFSGSYPDIPVAPDVDVDALTAGDAEPFYVTLPIGKPTVSANKVYYTAEFVQDLVASVNTKRPLGLMGHLADHERDSAFPLPAVHWVGATMYDGMAWGKGYIPPGEVREFLRRLKATSAKIATSIYGTASLEWDDDLQVWRPANFELESIDLAPPERAGVRDLATVPLITAEMETATAAPVPESIENEASETEQDMNVEEVIKQMTPDQAAYLPDAVVAELVKPHAAVLAELRETLGAETDQELVSAVKALKETAQRVAREAIENRLQVMLAEQIQGEDFEPARQLVLELVRATNPQTPEQAEAALQEVLERPYMKSVMEMTLVAAYGPKVRTPVTTPPAPAANKFVNIPDGD